MKKIDFSDVPKVYVYDMNGRAYLCFPDSSLLDVELAINSEISLLGVDNDGHVNKYGDELYYLYDLLLDQID